MGIIYLLTFADGKRYIGATTTRLNHRMNKHRSKALKGSKYPVHIHWLNYGEPEVKVLAYRENKHLSRSEAKFIREHDTVQPKG